MPRSRWLFRQVIVGLYSLSVVFFVFAPFYPNCLAVACAAYLGSKVLYSALSLILVIRKFGPFGQDDKLAVRVLPTFHLYGAIVWIKNPSREFVLENVELPLAGTLACPGHSAG